MEACLRHLSCLLSPDTPSQRVQFILGTEDDAEHVAHELFTELDEICVKDGKDAEWKETARSGTVSCILSSSFLLFQNHSNGIRNASASLLPVTGG